VRDGLWVVAAPGIRRLAGAPGHGRRGRWPRVLSAGLGAVASHRTAADLWGLDGFAALGRIDVTLPGPHGRRRRPGVVIHHTVAAGLERRTRMLVPVTGPARPLLELCAIADDLDALTALDEIRRLRLATWNKLWTTRVLHCGHGRPGAARYRRTPAGRWGRRVPDTLSARLFLLLLLARAGLRDTAVTT
jgi:hypothetical protein